MTSWYISSRGAKTEIHLRFQRQCPSAEAAGKTLAGVTSLMTSEVTCHPSWSSCHPSWSSCHPPPFCNRPTPSVSWRRQNAFKMRNLNLCLPSLPPQLSNASSPDKRFQRQGHGDFWTRIGYVGSSSHSFFFFFFFLSTSAFSPSSPVTGVESSRLKEIWRRRRRRCPSVRSFSRRVSSASERSPHEATCSQFLLVLALPGNALPLIWEGVLPPCVVARGFL